MITQDEIVTFPSSVPVGIMAEFLDCFLREKKILHQTFMKKDSCLSFLPGYQRLSNCFFQGKYHKWLQSSLDCSYAILSKLKTDNMFGVLENTYPKVLEYCRNKVHQNEMEINDPLMRDNLIPDKQIRNTISDTSLLEQTSTSAGSLIDKDEEETLDPPHIKINYLTAIEIIESNSEFNRFSRDILEFLLSIQGGGICMESIFHSRDTEDNYKMLQSMILSSLIWGRSSYDCFRNFYGIRTYLSRLEGSIVK